MFSFKYNGLDFSHSYAERPVEELGDLGGNMYHDGCFEIYVLLKGSVKMVVENQQKVLRPRDTVIIPPYALHHVEILEDKPYECMTFKLPTVFVSEFFADRIKSSGVFYVWPEDVVVFLERIEEFYDKYKAEGDSDEMLYLGMGTWLSAILVFMFRQDNVSDIATDAENLLAVQVMDYINSNLNRKLTMDDLCSEFHRSPSYIGKQFREYTGMPVMTYIRKKKMETARFLIMDRRIKPTDVAKELGYTDYSSFYKAYISVNGFPPKERTPHGDTSKAEEDPAGQSPAPDPDAAGTDPDTAS